MGRCITCRLANCNSNTEVVDNTPAVFLPSKILELTCKVFSYGVEIILPCILFISWCTEEDVKVFHKDFQKKNINHLLMTSRMFQLFLQLGWYETEVSPVIVMNWVWCLLKSHDLCTKSLFSQTCLPAIFA